MENIQKALEKARARRESGAPASSAPVGGAASPSGGYTRTRVIRPDPAALKEHRIIVAENGHRLTDTFRILRTQVMQEMTAGRHRTLAVTGPNPNEGKTFIAVNLAVSLAMLTESTVLLVDLDLRRPAVHKCFGLKPDVGLGEYLLHSVPLADCLINPGIDRLVVLPGGAPLRTSSELLSSPKMLSLARELKERYPDRVIVYDLPPLLVTDDALVFLSHAECCLLVASEGKTQVSDIQRSLELLQSTKLLGTVLNKSKCRVRGLNY